ncbi:acyl-CoA--sterol O-acyltransferase 1-like [Sesamum indicum]|uniref:Acyl-CoA--sterol O-acyltransferase 1-like n=1 Tax=Sesamum indicum TaxID=4182 RepID=A0A6I9UGG8_SESIN|nr:acyl-CoA--sterol O-acyltransferase 1-like [Sesamum indicum]
MSLQIIKVLEYWAEGEITNFIKVWALVVASLSYCFFAAKHLPPGLSRFLALLPVLLLNLILPLTLHTMHLGGSSAFFLAWLANFKLLLFAFGKGPLSDPSVSLPRFAALACLPIKSAGCVPILVADEKLVSLKKTDKSSESKTVRRKGSGGEVPIESQAASKTSKQGLKSMWNYVTKGLLICLFLKLYDYTDMIHPKLTWVLYSLHIYFGLEIILAIFGGLAKALVGIELEPQFDEPYLSASLQEFWGRRWNIMVTRILRPTVYEPVLYFSTLIIGRKWAPLPAVMGSFLVSALMHELIFFYLGRRKPSGEITLFFMLHGVCLAIEVAIKKAINGRWRLPKLMAAPLTVGFVMVTAFWLFFPEFLRCDSLPRAINEYAAIASFVKDVTEALTFGSLNNVTVV